MRGDTPVMPDLTYRHNDWNLTNDEQTRCLSYIIRHLSDFCTMPEGLKACVTSMFSITETVRLSAAEGYPAISLYEENDSHIDIKDFPDPLELERKLNAWIQEIGKQRLLELSAEETLTWQDVVEATDEIVSRNRRKTQSVASPETESFEELAVRLETEKRQTNSP